MALSQTWSVGAVTVDLVVYVYWISSVMSPVVFLGRGVGRGRACFCRWTFYSKCYNNQSICLLCKWFS